MKKLFALAALFAPLSAQAQMTGELVRFISCPVYRDADSGRKSGCWLANDGATGTRWDVSQSPYKPDWNFAILVEGRISSTQDQPCGAQVLDAVRTSILPEACPRHILPAEGFPGRKFILPRRNNDPVWAPRTKPEGPFAERSFNLFFEFNRAFIIYQYDDWLIDRAVTWIAAAKPKKLVVIGFAATRPETVSGQKIRERPDVANERANMVAETLRRLLPGMVVETKIQLNATSVDDPEADGLPSQSQRRAEIKVVF